MNSIVELDKRLFLFLNSFHSPFLDPIMIFFSNKLVWIPFYAWLVFLSYKKYGNKIWIVLLAAAILILLSDQISSSLIKPFVKRLRPCHDPVLEGLVYVTSKGCGGKYGFVSSHASNSFGLAMFVFLLFQSTYRWLGFLMFAWAIIIGFSRIYMGVHFPGDVLCGAFLGMSISLGCYRLINARFLRPEKNNR